MIMMMMMTSVNAIRLYAVAATAAVVFIVNSETCKLLVDVEGIIE